ncbi:MAG: hypothetical protein CVV53_00995 [Spirochaetae bacterium HGW-Spirochaetae-9]|nr:MAG: hypothetical protein CVV53_00995 [Spirochaetae bacterium HGW-Spirochaetae-9]
MDTIIFAFSFLLCDYGIMQGFTIAEMVEMLGLPHKTIMGRIRRASIEPTYRAGRIGLYSQEDFERIKVSNRPGRPAKKPQG